LSERPVDPYKNRRYCNDFVGVLTFGGKHYILQYMKKNPMNNPKVVFLGLLSINKATAWTCPNGQVNRGKDMKCWDTPCGCGAKNPKI